MTSTDDVLGPLLFTHRMQLMISKLKSQFNSWYLDDGTIADKADTVLEELKFIIEQGEKIGLALNTRKCELLIINEDNQGFEKMLAEYYEVAPNIRCIDVSILCLLRANILESAFDASLNNEMVEVQRMLTRLKDMS